jgi:hypothetical protein
MILQISLFDLFSWIVANPELGWILAVLYLFIEIRTPWGRIKDLTDLIKNTITVVRAVARVHSEIDTQGVDEYLLENGMDPNDFIDEKDTQGPIDGDD